MDRVYLNGNYCTRSPLLPQLTCTASKRPSDEQEEEEEVERGVLGVHAGMQAFDWLGRPADGRSDLGGWTCALCIAGSFCFLNAAFYGIVVNLVLYLVDIWGQSSGDAANNVTSLIGTTFLCSFVGAFASDAYLGRLWSSIAFMALSFIVQGVSMVVAVLGLVVAAVIEHYRLGIVHSGAVVSILWLVPQNFLLGIATNLMSSGSFDFFYTEVSDGMRTISGSIGLLFFGAGSYFSSIMVLLVNRISSHGSHSGWISSDLNDGHLDYFYWFLAGFLFCAFLLYAVYAHFYSYQSTLNTISSADGMSKA